MRTSQAQRVRTGLHAMTVHSYMTQRTPGVAAFLLRVPRHALALAVLAVVVGSALRAAGVTPPADAASARPPHAKVPVAAAPVARDDQDDEGDDGPQEEPQLELIPIVPASGPQSLAT